MQFGIDKKKDMIPTIFMHIQKTAGTTLVNLLREHYGLENSMSHGDHLAGFTEKTEKKVFFSKENILTRHQDKLFISGHFGYSFCSAFMKDRYSFTFLRNPVERILSFYSYCRSQPAEAFPINALAKEKPLEEFLRLGLSELPIYGYIWNIQAWQLAYGYCNYEGKGLSQFQPQDLIELAVKHLENFSFVGTLENFQQGRDTILRNLGIPLPDINSVENATIERTTIADLTDEEFILLQELTAADRFIYELVTDRSNP